MLTRFVSASRRVVASAREIASTLGSPTLEAEFEGSLAAVGVTLADFDLRATAGTPRTPRWGTSAKVALQRSVKLADTRRDRRVTPGHILLGVLRAHAGTVPRVLDRAGVDRTELLRRVEAAL